MGRAPNVLIAEDDFTTRDGLVDALAEQGYVVAIARDGMEALAALKHLARPALVLLDLQMPVSDGLEFLRRLHERPDRADFEVVVMSATVASEWFDKAPGVIRAMHKPFDVKELLAVVDDFFRRHLPTSPARLGERASPAGPRGADAPSSGAVAPGPSVPPSASAAASLERAAPALHSAAAILPSAAVLESVAPALEPTAPTLQPPAVLEPAPPALEPAAAVLQPPAVLEPDPSALGSAATAAGPSKDG